MYPLTSKVSATIADIDSASAPTLAPLLQACVSTVDSGNLAGALHVRTVIGRQ